MTLLPVGGCAVLCCSGPNQPTGCAVFLPDSSPRQSGWVMSAFLHNKNVHNTESCVSPQDSFHALPPAMFTPTPLALPSALPRPAPFSPPCTAASPLQKAGRGGGRRSASRGAASGGRRAAAPAAAAASSGGGGGGSGSGRSGVNRWTQEEHDKLAEVGALLRLLFESQ